MPQPPAEDRLVARLHRSIVNDEQITLVLGSGIGAGATPWVADMLRLADQYAVGRSDGGDLVRALTQARHRLADDAPVAVYAEYRRVFADWVSPDEFDVIAQQAVLAMYRPPDRMSTPLATHGIWQRVPLELGEWLENDAGSWQLPPAVETLGAILARMPGVFGHRVVTTNVDPLLEVAIRSAGGHAASVPLDPAGAYDRSAGHDGAVRVFHLHGFWRPTHLTGAGRLIPDPAQLAREQPVQPVAELISGDTVCVLGAGDRAGTLTAALAEVVRQRPVRVLWALHTDDEEQAVRRCERLSAAIGAPVECHPGVDSDRLVTLLARRLHVSVVPRIAGPRHRVRHPTWERLFVSQPDSVPPAEVPLLLRQLERRFAWKLQPATTGNPTLLFWPVRLRQQATVIHMAQALAAGALAHRGVRIVVSLDDFGIWQPEPVRMRFEAELARWVHHTGPAARPEFVSLSRFIEEQHASTSPERLLRPVDPWTVARDFYGDHSPSLYEVLAAVKAVPNVAQHDLEENAWPIVQALLRRNANRLLTPMTMWSFLHHLLLDNATSSVMTLGGRDEVLFWEQWRKVYGFGISQLYNPYIQSLSQESGMVRWSSADELRQHLAQLRGLPGWDREGGYISWLFSNAVLLPGYLNAEPVPALGEVPIDSWAAFLAALEDGLPVLDLLADRATLLYRGQ